MTDPAQYLRAGEIARLLGISKRTVRRRIKDETLPSTKVGGARFVARADLLRLLSPPIPLEDEKDDHAQNDEYSTG
jgi:excisionase family DNA binding protein